MRYAKVVSTLALFLSLGGVSYAVTQIDDNSVSARHVVNGSLTGTDVKNSTITGSDIKDGSITAIDVVGHLPGVTYFKYLGKDVALPNVSNQWSVLISDKVAKGVYSVTGQVLVQGQKGAHVDVGCQVLYKGIAETSPRAAYGFESRVLATNTSSAQPPWFTIDLSGVYEAPVDDTVVGLRCYGSSSNGPAVVHNARLQSVELRDVQIESEG